MKMNEPDEKKPHTITIKWTFNVPIRLVWEAWTQSEHIAE